METENNVKPTNFIREIMDRDLENNTHGGRIATRFPPEPSGYLHIGHVKAICINFSVTEDYPNATCHLRFDDTNPLKESEEYVESIKEDIKWLGYSWSGKVKHTSDYFDKLHGYAVELIENGKAYVCGLNAEQMREYRGDTKTPGKPSPDRERPIAENLRLFQEMVEGKYKEGEYTLRAKIDLTSPNFLLRDPIIYRILKVNHHVTGKKWCVYPMYDFSHCLSDAIENITHSLCTLEFQDNRALYDWFVDNTSVPAKPRQYESARLNLSYVVTSKRKLRALVEAGKVNGWDDPRIPTVRGLRRRGYTPEALKSFCTRVGVTKKNSVIDYSILEEELRNDLNERSPRAFAVLNPLKVVITNYPEDKEEELSAPNHPKKEEMGRRIVPFSRELYIERDDFLEEAPPKFFRLAPGKEVRLRFGYVIQCNEVIKDSEGSITELRCTYDENTLGKKPEGRKVKGIIHWVSAKHAVDAEVRVYDRLFSMENPADEKEKDITEIVNPDSLQIRQNCKVEPSLARVEKGSLAFQFERLGYFFADPVDYTSQKPVFNRAVTLKDTWAVEQKKG